MLFLKEDLLCHHYNWSNDTSGSKYSGEPGRCLFDPFNGNQVLYIINFFGKSLGMLSVSQGHALEELMIRQLPADLKSELSVFNWLRDVYMYYGE